MDKLTPQLNKAQLQANIDGLLKQGAQKDVVQKYVDNYSQDANGNFVLKAPVAPPTPPDKSLGDYSAEAITAGANKIKDSVTGGATKYQEGVDQANKATNIVDAAKGEIKATVGLLESGLGTASGFLQTLFSPATAVVNKTSDVAAKQAQNPNTPIYKIANSKFGDYIAKGEQGFLDWAKAHPELATNLSDTLNVGTAVVAGGNEKIGLPSLDTLKNDYATIKNGITDTVGTIKDNIPAIKDTIVGAKDTVVNAKNAVKEKITGNPTNPVDVSIENTMPLQNKGARIDELRNALPDNQAGQGGVERKGILGKPKPVPNATDIKVGTEAHPYIDGVKDPLQRIQNVNQGIVDTSKSVDAHLNQNPTNGNFEDIRSYMETNKPSSTLQGDTGATEAYNRATQGAINKLADTLKATGDTSPSISGADIRKARIEIDQEITRQLGETTFDSPQYKGIKAAEVDTRNLINRMNEDMLRYPDQLAKLNKMNDFISSAKERGIEVDMNNPQTKAELQKQFGLESTPESEANANNLKASHDKMSNLYTARDNMIERFQNNVGKGNKIIEWAKAHPKTAKALGWGVTLIGGDWVLRDLILK